MSMVKIFSLVASKPKSLNKIVRMFIFDINVMILLY